MHEIANPIFIYLFYFILFFFFFHLYYYYFFFFFFCTGDNLNEVSNPIFMKNKKKCPRKFKNLQIKTEECCNWAEYGYFINY